MDNKSAAFRELIGIKKPEEQTQLNAIPIRSQTEDAVRKSTNEQMLGQLFNGAFSGMAQVVIEKGSPSMQQAIRESNLYKLLG